MFGWFFYWFFGVYNCLNRSYFYISSCSYYHILFFLYLYWWFFIFFAIYFVYFPTVVLINEYLILSFVSDSPWAWKDLYMRIKWRKFVHVFVWFWQHFNMTSQTSVKTTGAECSLLSVEKNPLLRRQFRLSLAFLDKNCMFIINKWHAAQINWFALDFVHGCPQCD